MVQGIKNTGLSVSLNPYFLFEVGQTHSCSSAKNGNSLFLT